MPISDTAIWNRLMMPFLLFRWYFIASVLWWDWECFLWPCSFFRGGMPKKGGSINFAFSVYRYCLCAACLSGFPMRLDCCGSGKAALGGTKPDAHECRCHPDCFGWDGDYILDVRRIIHPVADSRIEDHVHPDQENVSGQGLL